jgi:hypothetical protein
MDRVEQLGSERRKSAEICYSSFKCSIDLYVVVCEHEISSRTGVSWLSRIDFMQTVILANARQRGPATHRHAVAIANIRWFRAMAWRALRDGGPQGVLRAANARAAAHIVLRHARRDALVNRLVTDALAGG